MDEQGQVKLGLLADVIVVVVGVLLAIYFLADDTPEDWLVRLGFAGAITAGLALLLGALLRLLANVDRHPQP